MSINYRGWEQPIEVMVIGKLGSTRVLPVEFQIAPDGEIVTYRAERLVQFYSDYGRRTVAVGDISIRK